MLRVVSPQMNSSKIGWIRGGVFFRGQFVGHVENREAILRCVAGSTGVLGTRSVVALLCWTPGSMLYEWTRHMKSVVWEGAASHAFLEEGRFRYGVVRNTATETSSVEPETLVATAVVMCLYSITL